MTSDPTTIDPGLITSWVAIGDSITSCPKPGTQTGTKLNGGFWPWVADIARGVESGRIDNGNNLAFAVSGHSLLQAISHHIPAVLALDPKPSHAVLQYGTNDAGDYPVPMFREYYETAVGMLRAGGVEPIVMTCPPSQPYNGTTTFVAANRGSKIAAMNRALWDMCSELGIRLIDNRHLEDPTTEGQCHRGLCQEGELYGVHPWDSWHLQVGYNVAKTLERYGNGADAFAAHPVINSDPDFENYNPQVLYPAQNTTYQIGRIDRANGGKYARIWVENTGTKSIGAGDTGIEFSAAPGVDLARFDVSIHAQNGFSTADGLPAVAVVPIMGTNRQLILVKPQRPATAFTSTVQEVIDAVNNHPEASALCVASATGTPGSLALPNASASNTIAPAALHSHEPSSPTAEELALADTDLVRGLVEVWLPAGATPPGLRLAARNNYGAGNYSTISSYNWTTIHNSIGAPIERLVIATPWVVAGEFRRFSLLTYLGGAEGEYIVGRPYVQRKST